MRTTFVLFLSSLKVVTVSSELCVFGEPLTKESGFQRHVALALLFALGFCVQHCCQQLSCLISVPTSRGTC